MIIRGIHHSISTKKITVDLAILIEIFAIREDLLMATASRWALFAFFLLESDRSNAIV